MMKRTFCFLLALAALLALTACGGKTAWRSDVPVSRLCEAVEKHVKIAS